MGGFLYTVLPDSDHVIHIIISLSAWLTDWLTDCVLPRKTQKLLIGSLRNSHTLSWVTLGVHRFFFRPICQFLASLRHFYAHFQTNNSWNWMPLSTTVTEFTPHTSRDRYVFTTLKLTTFLSWLYGKTPIWRPLKLIFEKFGSRSSDFVASIWRANHSWCMSQNVSYMDFWFEFQCPLYPYLRYCLFVNQICTNVCQYMPAWELIGTSVYH